MELFFYCLRRKGVRQSAEALLAVPARRGWLTYQRPMKFGMPGTQARLLDVDTRRNELTAGLNNARIGRVDGGLLLTGVEQIITRTARDAIQTWAMAPTEEGLAHLVRTIKQKQDVITAISAELRE